MQLVRLLLAGGAFGPFAFDGDGVTGGEAGQLAREAAITHAAEPTHSLFGEIRRQNNLQRRQRGAVAQGRKSNALLLADGTHPAVDADALALARAGEQAGDGRGESHSSARCRAPRAGGRQLGHHLGQRGAGRVLMLSELTGGFSTRSGCRNSQDRASPKRGPRQQGSGCQQHHARPKQRVRSCVRRRRSAVAVFRVSLRRTRTATDGRKPGRAACLAALAPRRTALSGQSAPARVYLARGQGDWQASAPARRQGCGLRAGTWVLWPRLARQSAVDVSLRPA